MKIDISYSAIGSKKEEALLGWGLNILAGLIFACAFYLFFKNLYEKRADIGVLVIFITYLPVLLKRQLFGPAVLSVNFLPPMFSYWRGFRFLFVRIKSIRSVSEDPDYVHVVKKNGKHIRIPKNEFPGVDFPALGRQLQLAAETHTDILTFFQSRPTIPGFAWIDPSISRPVTPKEKRVAIAIGLVTLVFIGFLLLVL